MVGQWAPAAAVTARAGAGDEAVDSPADDSGVIDAVLRVNVLVVARTAALMALTEPANTVVSDSNTRGVFIINADCTTASLSELEGLDVSPEGQSGNQIYFFSSSSW
jgi:hypothetical protein